MTITLTLSVLLLILAAVCELMAAIVSVQAKFPRCNLTALGLFLWILSLLLGLWK